MIISPSLYFPPILLFSYWLRHEDLILEQFETYQKRTFRNKCEILGPNGPMLLSVPLQKGKHRSQLITNVNISFDENWIRQHLMSIKSCYGKAPYFDYYFPGIQNLLMKAPEKLFDLNVTILKHFKRLLHLEGTISFSNAYSIQIKEEQIDLRNSFGTKSTPSKFKECEFKKYMQVFDSQSGFSPNLSILDLLFCMGPEARAYL